MGTRETFASWRDESPFANCKTHHLVTDISAHLQAVKSGMGFAYLFCFMADRDKDLVRLPQADTDKGVTAWILTHPDMIATERVRVCTRYLVDAIQKQEPMLQGQV